MIEKGDGINFGSSRVQIESNQKKKVVAIVSIGGMAKTDQYRYKFHADQMKFW